MLDAIHNMDEDVKVLEVVSDAEEMAVTLESEHEEGEISEDDDDDEVGLPGQQHFPHHYPSGGTPFCCGDGDERFIRWCEGGKGVLRWFLPSTLALWRRYE